MPQGYIDQLKSSGYVEGWAFDPAAPGRPVAVAVLGRGGKEVAWGLAHRYRDDLVAAGIGTGWCGFRLRLEVPLRRVRDTPLRLIERGGGATLHQLDHVPYDEDAEPPIGSPDALQAADPTVIDDIGQLRGCDPLFSAYIKAGGVSAFVRAAYIYVLGRPADPGGLALYGGLIRQAKLQPAGLLAILADCDEFRSRPRALAAPSAAAFPFRSA